MAIDQLKKRHKARAEQLELEGSEALDRVKNRSDKASELLRRANIERYKAELIKKGTLKL